MAEELDGKLRNDNKQTVRFKAIASVPCFELWLLLHYEDIQASLHRDTVLQRLKAHLPALESGWRSRLYALRHYQKNIAPTQLRNPSLRFMNWSNY